jgi:hypothetical protein
MLIAVGPKGSSPSLYEGYVFRGKVGQKFVILSIVFLEWWEVE